MKKQILNFLASLSRDRKGAVAIIFAVSLIPLIVCVGAAVDMGRAYLVKQRLQQAIDAAGLAVGSAFNNGQDPNAVLTAFFNANYPAAKLGTPGTPNLVVNGSQITIAADANLNTAFMKIVGINTITVNANVQVTRETSGLEVALVMDNTGSMGNGGKLDSLKVAASDLVNILFGNEDMPNNLKIGLVPFAGAVNIGNVNGAAYVSNPNVNNWGPTTWGGCVMARPYPRDVDDSPVALGGVWQPFYWADTPSSWAANDWIEDDGDVWVDMVWPSSQGPNKACPRALTPLTNSKAALLNEINGMWASGYTHVNQGAVWGWRVVSPDEPFSEGVAYGTAGWNKAVIILTDGMNTTHDWQYTAYGYRWEGVLGSTTEGGTRQELNDRLAEVCQNMKDEGIAVYTITFQLNDVTTQNLFRNCATDSNKYYNSPTNAELQVAFRAIGAELKRLHISQ